MDKIILLPNREKDEELLLSLRILEVLRNFCTRIYTGEANRTLIEHGAVAYSEDTFPKDAELLLVLGGDGTMLHAAALAAAHDIPMLGVNMGRLGYLASVDPDEINELASLAENTYLEQTRMLLDVFIERKTGERAFLGNALNDLVIDGRGHLSDLRLYEKKSYFDYRANGLIVATPTGSTAYSLSAGGAVLDETMDAICVTPACPRSFFSRSIVFPADTELRIENINARGDVAALSLDGCTDAVLPFGDAVVVTRSAKRVRLLMLKPRRMLEVLSTKMNTQHF